MSIEEWVRLEKAALQKLDGSGPNLVRTDVD
jgi:hypothetical protein